MDLTAGKEINEHHLTLSVDELGLPFRLVNALHASRIRKVGDMLNLYRPYALPSFYNLAFFPRIGPDSLAQIVRALYNILEIDLVEIEHHRGNDFMLKRLERRYRASPYNAKHYSVRAGIVDYAFPDDR